MGGAHDVPLAATRVRPIARLASDHHRRMHPWQLAGSALAALHSLPVTDLGPYWAVRHGLPATLDMLKMTFNWPAKVIAARRRALIVEVPVS
jgi:hypothetical protein